MRPGIILDRDGTLIDVVRDEETGVISVAFSPSQLRFLPGVLEGLSLLSAAGFGFDPQTFFRTDDVSRQVMSRDIAYLDAHRLRPLLQESFFHAPIELSRQERVQLYLLFENVQVAAAGAAVVPVVVFARNTLPYRGTARYGFARYELGRFAPRVV